MGAAAHLAADQPGVLQRLDVLGRGGERHREGLGQLADRPLAAGEMREACAGASASPRAWKTAFDRRFLIQPYG